MSVYVTCVNCLKQNHIEDDDTWNVKCEYGNHKVRIKKEGAMVGTINASDLNPETREKLGIDKIAMLPPVPPRPDTTGMKLGEKLKASHDYYEANKPAILHDLDVLGEPEMLKRWNITPATWGTEKVRCGLRNRWRPEIYGKYISYSIRKKLSKAAGAPALEKPGEPKKSKKFKTDETLVLPPPSESEKGNQSKPESTAVDKGLDLKARPEGNLPVNLPEFRDYWDKEVQIAWLKTFIELKTLQMVAGIIDKKNEYRQIGWFRRIFPRS